jgi:hypothetical protein
MLLGARQTGHTNWSHKPVTQTGHLSTGSESPSDQNQKTGRIELQPSSCWNKRRCYEHAQSGWPWLLQVTEYMAVAGHRVHGCCRSQSTWLLQVRVHGCCRSQSTWLLQVTEYMAVADHRIHVCCRSQITCLLQVRIVFDTRLEFSLESTVPQGSTWSQQHTLQCVPHHL